MKQNLKHSDHSTKYPQWQSMHVNKMEETITAKIHIGTLLSLTATLFCNVYHEW